MAAALTTTLTELGESRVRLHVQVPAQEVEGRLERKAQQLGRELKLPGFRRGKVPAPLVIQRIGREVVLEEAVRDTLSSWYSDAIAGAGIVPVGDPQLDLGELPPRGEALEFSIEIGVLPKAQLGDYKGLEVPRREPQVEEQIDAQVEEMRERLARLQSADRAAQSGDFVVIDYLGSMAAAESAEDAQSAWEPFAGGEGRDQLVELGGGNLIPGFEEALVGSSAGETRTVALTFPADYGNTEIAGREASFEVTVKEVKLKELPAVDEDFAIDAGFDDVAELREDIHARLLEVEQGTIEAEFRQAALDAAVAAATIEVTPELTSARARDVGAHAALALTPRHHARDLPADRRARGAGHPRRDAARSRSRAAPRGGYHGDRRRRADEPIRAGGARRARADRRARGHRGRDIARGPEHGGTPRGGPRGPRCTPGDRPRG